MTRRFARIAEILKDCSKSSRRLSIITLAFLSIATTATGLAQTELPPPGPTKSANIPAIREFQLPNGLRVAVVEKKSVPLVTAYLLIRSGADSESEENAGLAKITATMLTRGTASRSAEKIAEDIEFLGGSIDSGAGRLSSFVTVTVTTGKLASALSIFSDVVLRPKFAEEELAFLKSQTLDELKFSLTQPGFLANYVASKAVFGEHPVGGTPESIRKITSADIKAFYKDFYRPANATLIFVGDISPLTARSLSMAVFGSWHSEPERENGASHIGENSNKPVLDPSLVLIIDLPNSGQSAVNYFLRLASVKRNSPDYYTASVYNSILGGGYSSRLNQEIRIKRGLSYGAGSSFQWRANYVNFSARAQTKNESAPEVAKLMTEEINRLADQRVAESELIPRKSVLIGSFGRGLETTASLATNLAELYSLGVQVKAINDYISKIDAVQPEQIRNFANDIKSKGTIVIVGDYAKFRQSLDKMLPNHKVRVVSAVDLNLSGPLFWTK